MSPKCGDYPEADEQVPIAATIGVVSSNFRRQRDYCRNNCNNPNSAPSQSPPARSLTVGKNLVQRRRRRQEPLFVFSDSHDDLARDRKPHTVESRKSEVRSSVTPGRMTTRVGGVERWAR
jgi:hypothetical protein